MQAILLVVSYDLALNIVELLRKEVSDTSGRKGWKDVILLCQLGML